MRKQLTVALGLAVLATHAFATKARLEALGEDNFGSYYINDNRNIFLNAAKINENKDLVTFEFGANTTNAQSAYDQAQAPRAEGGFTKSAGNFVYGAHFGNSTPTAQLVRSLIKSGDGQERMPIDIFLGGDAGVKWGVNVTWESYDGRTSKVESDETTPTDLGQATPRVSSNSLRTRLGVIAGDFEAFGIVSLQGDAKDRLNNQAVEGKASYLIGVGQWWNNYKFFADYNLTAADYGTVGDTKDKFELKQIRLGTARQSKLSDKATFYTKAMLVQRTVSADANVVAGEANDWTLLFPAAEVQDRTLPVTVGLEYDALSWLQLRASVIHNVWGAREVDPKGTGSKTKSSIANTSVRAGASLKFGDFSVDGLISTLDDSNKLAETGATDPSTNNGNGVLSLDRVMSRVSMTYRF